MAVPIKFKRPAPRMSSDPARQNRNGAPPALIETGIGTVGYADSRTSLPEGTPAWLRWEQGELLVEVTLKDEDRICARLGCECELVEGQQVALAFPEGEPNAAIIVGVLNSALEPAPSSVAGVLTGAGAATEKGVRVPGATWRFVRLENGRMLAIQTNDADINIWAGAGLHLKATAGAIHLDGTTHLGAKPITPPIGSSAAPGGEEIPGVPAVPYVPTPYVPPAPQPPAQTPYVGNDDGIVRAKDLFQSNVAIDPVFWAWIIGVDAVARGINQALPPAPTNVYSAVSGAAGPGSKHTASGDFELV
jgi:hypothetical protein